MTGSSAHITSNRNNRALQKGGRRSFFKSYKISDYGRRGQGRSIDLSTNRLRKANQIRNKRYYLPLSIIFLVFVSFWWYVFNL